MQSQGLNLKRTAGVWAIVIVMLSATGVRAFGDSSSDFREVRRQFLNKMDGQWKLIASAEDNFKAQSRAVASLEKTLNEVEASAVGDDRASSITKDFAARFQVALGPVFEAFKVRGKEALDHCQRVHEGINFLKMRSPADDADFVDDEDIFTGKVTASLCPSHER